jgi:alkylhydroperoxidase/carboxymuconolactone decarboxylase family protein YurZ
MTEQLPGRPGRLAKQNPDVWRAYQALGKACYEAGPLSDKTRRLVKLALAVGSGSEGAVHSQTRRGLKEGATADELRHVAFLAIPSIGFAKAIAALTWIDDIVEK